MQRVHLAAGRDVVGDVVDLGRFGLRRRDRHPLGVAQVLAGGVIDPLRHGGREEGGLALARGPGQDLGDLRAEAAIEHLVGLVENEEADVIEAEVALAVEIGDATRRADDDLGAATKRVFLRTHRAATVDKHGLDAGSLSEGVEHAANLDRELAGRGQDEDLDGLDRGIDRLDGGNAEGEGLAGAGPGLADEIASLEQDRQAIGLDRRRDSDVHAGQRGVSRPAQIEIGERRDRRMNG